MANNTFKYTQFKLEKLNKVEEILYELEEYKPLTLRQIYYQMVGKGFIPNNKSQYNMLSELLKWARIDCRISWNDIEDRSRFYNSPETDRSLDSFVKAWDDSYLSGFKLDYLASQQNYIELWYEKDAITSVIRKIASKYRLPTVAATGYNSITFQHDFTERINNKPDKQPVILFASDFDPSGLDMFESIQKTINDEMGFNHRGIIFRRVALSRKQIDEFHLPKSIDAIKPKDSRAPKFIKEYGNIAVEIDALKPSDLQRIIEDAVLEYIDPLLLEQKMNEEKLVLLNIQEFLKDFYVFKVSRKWNLKVGG